MWDGVEAAATVAQLVGVDAGKLIAKIRQAARTVQQNSSDCKLLAQRVDMIGELLPHLQTRRDPEAERVLTGLRGTLSEAHDLVMSCHGMGRTYRFFRASRMADRFRDVEKKLDSYFQFMSAIACIGINRINNRLDDADQYHYQYTTSSHRSQSLLQQQQQELGRAEDRREFTLAEIAVATSNFDVVLSADADSGTKVYKGKLHNGPDVAVKRLNRGRRGAEDAFFVEQQILSPLRHKHIIHLLGTCADDGERMLVTEYMPNGSLYDHLHGISRGTKQTSPSPVTSSWKTRVQVLLGVARAVEHLHCHAMPLIIHANVTSSNVLLDAAWAPRLSGFGASLWQAAGVVSQAAEVAGASCGGYADPEYCSTGHIRPASDVYSFGVVMLEALTGQPPMVSVWEEASKQGVVIMPLPSFVLPHVEAGRLGDVLDRRPVPQSTTWQLLQPLQLVANTAVRCLSLHGDNRPKITDVVVNLEQALRLL